MNNDIYFIVAETKNGKAFPHWAGYFREGKYAEAVRAANSRSDGAFDIETDDQAAEFESEAKACRVQFISTDEAADWFDPEHPESPVMKAMITLGWVEVNTNEETGETTYELSK